MRANSRYVEIARGSLKDNQAAFYAELKRKGKLEKFLAKRAKDAEDQASLTHQRNLANGVQPAVSWPEAESQAIRDNLLFPSKEEQDSPDGYH